MMKSNTGVKYIGNLAGGRCSMDCMATFNSDAGLFDGWDSVARFKASLIRLIYLLFLPVPESPGPPTGSLCGPVVGRIRRAGICHTLRSPDAGRLGNSNKPATERPE